MARRLENTAVIQPISKLFLQSNLADIHFEFTNHVETVRIPAHKIILAAASPVFEAMFFGLMKESNDTIEIVDASANGFKEFLQLFYSLVVTITMDYMEEVVRLADKYDMTDRLNTCLATVEKNLATHNVVWVYQLASLLNNRPLQLACELKLKACTTEIFKSESFLHCDKSVIEHILKSEALNCTEFDLFKACVKWAKIKCAAKNSSGNDPLNLRNQLGDLFQLIRFETMSNDDVAMIMSSKPGRSMFSHDELADIFCMKSEKISKANGYNMPRPARKMMWNEEAVLKFDINRGGNRSILPEKKSTWFSVNVPLLLGQIWWTNVYLDQTKTLSNNACAISIVEYSQRTFPVADSGSVRCTATVELDDICLVPRHPILVEPSKMYEIIFEIVMEGKILKAETLIPQPHQNSADEEICISFHATPECILRGGGLVSSLGFNRI